MPAGDSIPALFMRTQSEREFKTATARIVSYPIIVREAQTTTPVISLTGVSSVHPI
jgi:hypothetical protein